MALRRTVTALGAVTLVAGLGLTALSGEGSSTASAAPATTTSSPAAPDPVIPATTDAPATPAAAPVIARVAGGDRYETAAKIAVEHLARHGAVDAVYLATGRDFPDALTGGALAASQGNPVLLTRPGGLPGVTRTALETLGRPRVYVLGGESAVNGTVLDELAAMGITATRVAGPNRYETAAQVSRMLAPSEIVYVATGDNYPDALAAVPAAGLDASPVLLTRHGSLPGAAVNELRRHDPRLVVVMGGTVAVGTDVVDQIWDLGYEPLRVAGNDRFQTAAALSGVWPSGSSTAWVATGMDFADALAAGPAAAAEGGAIVLTRQASLPGATATTLLGLTPREVRVLGGTVAIDPAVEDQIAALPWG